jgi:hypothetical protein
MENINIITIEGIDAREVENEKFGDALFAPCSVCDRWHGNYPPKDSLFYGYVADDIFYHYSDDEFETHVMALFD